MANPYIWHEDLKALKQLCLHGPYVKVALCSGGLICVYVLACRQCMNPHMLMAGAKPCDVVHTWTQEAFNSSFHSL